jgi:hypothetical protein
MDFKGLLWEGVDWIHLAHNRDQWWALVGTDKNSSYIKCGEFLNYQYSFISVLITAPPPFEVGLADSHVLASVLPNSVVCEWITWRFLPPLCILVYTSTAASFELKWKCDNSAIFFRMSLCLLCYSLINLLFNIFLGWLCVFFNSFAPFPIDHSLNRHYVFKAANADETRLLGFCWGILNIRISRLVKI